MPRPTASLFILCFSADELAVGGDGLEVGVGVYLKDFIKAGYAQLRP